MIDLDPSFVAQPQPLREVLIDPFPERFVLLDLMVSFGQGAATGTAEGTDGKALLLSKGEIAGCHQKISIPVDRLDGIPTASEFGNVGKPEAQPLCDLSGRDLIIQGPYRHRASQIEGILRKRRAIL
jgi:hypothetical protein